MKKIQIILRLVMALLLPGISSCSSLIASRGKDVFKYQEHPQSFSREQVIADLGRPTSTDHLRPPLSTKSKNERIRMVTSTIQTDSNTRIAIIDEHFIKGPVFDQCANYAAVIFRSFAIITCGLSEIYFLPVALSTENPDKVFYTYYDSNGRLITSNLEPSPKMMGPKHDP